MRAEVFKRVWDACLGPPQISMMNIFGILSNDCLPLTIFAKGLVIDIWQYLRNGYGEANKIYKNYRNKTKLKECKKLNASN